MAFHKRFAFLKATALVLALVLLALGFTSCGKSKGAVSAKVGEITETKASFTKNEYHFSQLKNLVFVASSGLIELYFDSVNYSVAVRDTNNDKFWYALPEIEELSENCDCAVLSVRVSKDNKIYYLNSQDNSVAFGSASFRPTSSGIQITYNMALDRETAQAGFAENSGELYISVSVSVSLSDGSLSVKLNCGDIMLSDGYVLESIELLNYFGAYENSGKDDYIFVPDRSGAVIKTGSEADDEYGVRNYRVYGKDISMGSLNNLDENGSVEFARALVPAFGIKSGDNAFTGIILSGDTVSTISSHRYTQKGTYNRVGPSFRITDVTYSGDETKKTKYIGERYTGELNISYRFLSGKSAGYIGFSSACREMLIREGVLPSTQVEAQAHIPFAVAVQAACAKNSTHSYKILSDYEQTLDMLEVMKAKSINNITLRYCGALDGANSQDLISKAGTIGALGNKRDFSQLKQYVLTQKFDMYLDMSIVSLNKRSLFSENIAENMAGEAISYNSENGFSKISGKESLKAYAVALSDVEKNVLKFLNGSKDYQFDAFCINDAGNILYSDYSDEAHNRSNAVNIITPQVQMLSNNHKLMVSGGYFYILKDADYVSDLAEKTDYPETEAYVQVPFVEAVLHGIMDYSLEPVNLSEDPEKAFMKAVEYGAIPSYKWYCTKTGEESADSVYYYENALDKAVEKYLLADEALGNLRDAKITDHREIRDGVYSTEYNNSTVIYFNYNDSDETVNSVKVGAKSFIRVG